MCHFFDLFNLILSIDFYFKGFEVVGIVEWSVMLYRHGKNEKSTASRFAFSKVKL